VQVIKKDTGGSGFGWPATNSVEPKALPQNTRHLSFPANQVRKFPKKSRKNSKIWFGIFLFGAGCEWYL